MLKKTLILLLCLTTLVCYAQQEKKNVVFKVRKHQIAEEVVIATVEEEAFQIVDEPATFQGGNVTDFRNWVQSKIVYPESAIKAKIGGKVYAQFSVNSKGKVGDVRITRSIRKDIDDEVLRVILSSPIWVPGKQGGRAVKQLFVIPVEFTVE